MSASVLRRLIVAGLPLLAATAIAPAAHASVLTYEGPPDGEVLVLRSAPGEVDRVDVQDGPIADSVSLYDPNETITQIPWQCAREGYGVECHAPNGARLELGDQDDSAVVSSDVTVPVTMLGGPGDDQLSGNDAVNVLSGDAGNDTLKGDGGDDTLDGGDGNDTLDGYSGADHLQGGAGDDLLTPDGYETPSADVVDGGPGVDRIEGDYVTRDPDAPQPPSTFTLGGGADDGRPSEGDDIRNVERFTLSRAATFVGTDANEYVKLHQVGDAGDLKGMGGDDELRGGDGADSIDGGSGNDLIDGGYGDDTIIGGPGRDRISADLMNGDCGPYWCKVPYGNDVVLVRDGEVDSVTCGAGTDRVVADDDDVVSPDCEIVERGAAATAAPGGSGTPVPGKSGQPQPATTSSKLQLAVTGAPRLRAALRRGLRVRVTGASPRSTVTVRALYAGRTVASGSSRTGIVVVRFGVKARRSLARKRSVRLTLVAGAGRSTLTLLR